MVPSDLLHTCLVNCWGLKEAHCRVWSISLYKQFLGKAVSTVPKDKQSSNHLFLNGKTCLLFPYIRQRDVVKAQQVFMCVIVILCALSHLGRSLTLLPICFVISPNVYQEYLSFIFSHPSFPICSKPGCLLLIILFSSLLPFPSRMKRTRWWSQMPGCRWYVSSPSTFVWSLCCNRHLVYFWTWCLYPVGSAIFFLTAVEGMKPILSCT